MAHWNSMQTVQSGSVAIGTEESAHVGLLSPKGHINHQDYEPGEAAPSFSHVQGQDCADETSQQQQHVYSDVNSLQNQRWQDIHSSAQCCDQPGVRDASAPEAAHVNQHSTQQDHWLQEQPYYTESAGSARHKIWEEQVSQQTYDSDTDLTADEIRNKHLHIASDAAAQAAISQLSQQQWQEQQPTYNANYQIADFNACPTWNGPFPGFVFKLGESGLGYYREDVLKTNTSSATLPIEPSAKPRVISSNKSIVKGLTLKSGMIKKKKKDTELETGAMQSSAYLREMQAWSKQACSSEKGSGSLVK